MLVIIHLPPVDNVGDNDVQNSLAILGSTNANSSRNNKLTAIPRIDEPEVPAETIRELFENSIDFLFSD